MSINWSNDGQCQPRRFACVNSESKVTQQFIDDVIRKRLLFDAEGTSGDDRRINTLLKTFMRWCNAKEAGAEER